MSLHVVIGAGTVGSSLASVLADQGHDVRVVTRSGRGPSAPGIELVRADAADPDALRPHVVGAETLYNCANPPSYPYWAKVWPPLAASVLATAEATGAALAIMGNLYGYGPVAEPMTRDHQLVATSRKGRLRSQIWHDALAAHSAGRVRVTEARASDFIGPGIAPTNGYISRYTRAALAGKTVHAFGDPDAPHSWTYVADVARTLAALGTDERAFGQAWHVPTNPPLSVRQVVTSMAALAGAPVPRVRGVQRSILRLTYPFSALLREIDEVLYQHDRPFEIDATVTTSTFGIEATPWDRVLRETLASLRAESVG